MHDDRPPPIEQTVFEETQTLWSNPIIWAIMPVSAITTSAIMLAVGLGQPPAARATLAWVWAAVTASEVLLPWVLRVRTRVTDRTLHVSFVPICRRRIPLEEVEEAEAIRYEPMRDAGGWGLKSSARYGLAFTAAGDRAVRVVAGKRRLLIGSQRADELEAAIRRAAPHCAAERQAPQASVPMNGCA